MLIILTLRKINLLKIEKERNMNKIFKALRSEKGFTLIELLVVIAILGAIAGIVVLNVGGFIGRGQCEGYCTEKHNIQTAVIASCTENGTYTGYTSYLIGAPKFTWGPTSCSAAVPDATDKPSQTCDCFD
jgi:prepilin-type N-terminal cleavage/methylation domain-containing protein